MKSETTPNGRGRADVMGVKVESAPTGAALDTRQPARSPGWSGSLPWLGGGRGPGEFGRGGFGLRALSRERILGELRWGRLVRAGSRLVPRAGLDDDLAVLDLQAFETADHLGIVGILVEILGEVLLAQVRHGFLGGPLAVDLERV